MSTIGKRVATNQLSPSTEHYREAYSGLGTGSFHNNIFKNEKKKKLFFFFFIFPFFKLATTQIILNKKAER